MSWAPKAPKGSSSSGSVKGGAAGGRGRGKGGRHRGRNRQKQQRAKPQSQQQQNNDKINNEKNEIISNSNTTNNIVATTLASSTDADLGKNKNSIKKFEEEEKQRKENEEKLKKIKDEENEKKINEEKKLIQLEIDRKSAQTRYEDAMKAWQHKCELREKNTLAYKERPILPKKLDSSIKKTTAFVRKTKNLADQSIDSLLREFEKLNLSHYVSEIINALSETKLSKNSDINNTILLASKLHQRYAEFSSNFITTLLQVFNEIDVSNGCDKNNIIRKRSILKLLTELFFCGILKDSNIILNLIRNIMKGDRGTDSNHIHLLLVVSFLRYGGEEFLGIISRKNQQAIAFAQINQSNKNENNNMIDDNIKKTFLNLFHKYYKFISMRYMKLYKKLKIRETEDYNIQMTKGILTETRQISTSELKESFDKLERNFILLCDLIDTEMPILPSLEELGLEEQKINLSNIVFNKNGNNQFSGPFEDEHTNAFYRDLPDLRVIVPAVLLDDIKVQDKDNENTTKNEDESKDNENLTTTTTTKDKGIQQQQQKNDDKILTESTITMIDEENTTNISSTTTDLTISANTTNEDDITTNDNQQTPIHSTATTPTPKKSHGLELLFQTIPNAMNRDAIDQVSEKFCQFNSKSNRKALVRAAFNLHRNDLHLIPYWCRFITTVSQLYNDIAIELSSLLKSEFFRFQKKKDQFKKESRIRNAIFLSELTKFKSCSDLLIFQVLDTCLKDFVHHNIDVTVAILENCGRYLYLNPDTHVRLMMILERMNRLKSATTLDYIQESLVENAYYLCIPPDKILHKKKEHIPLHDYIKKLIYQDLNCETVEIVLKRLRKLPWDEECTKYILRCLLRVHRVRFSDLSWLASVICGLSKFYPIAIPLVDGVLEKIRVGLETNIPSTTQNRLAYISFLGELYNYNLVNSHVIFDTLYLLITFGHNVDKQGHFQSDLDLRDNTFRILLVVTLLDTCGQYFDRTSGHGLWRRLQRYLLCFQRYCFLKYAIPLDLDFAISDLFDKIASTFPRCTTMEEIENKLNKMDQEDQKQYPTDHLIRMSEFTNIQTLDTTNIIIPTSVGGGDDDEEERSESDASASEADDDDDDDDDDEVAVGSEDESIDESSGGEEDGGAECNSDHDSNDSNTRNVDDEDYHRIGTDAKKIEEVEFEREFERMIQHSIEERQYEPRVANLPEARSFIYTPTTLSHKNAKSAELTSAHEDNNMNGNNNKKKFAKFKLITKRHNKTQFRDIQVPFDSELAQTRDREEKAQWEEQQERKRLLIQGLEGLDLDQDPNANEISPLPVLRAPSNHSTQRISNSSIKSSSDGTWTGCLSLSQLNMTTSSTPSEKDRDRDRSKREVTPQLELFNDK